MWLCVATGSLFLLFCFILFHYGTTSSSPPTVSSYPFSLIQSFYHFFHSVLMIVPSVTSHIAPSPKAATTTTRHRSERADVSDRGHQVRWGVYTHTHTRAHKHTRVVTLKMGRGCHEKRERDELFLGHTKNKTDANNHHTRPVDPPSSIGAIWGEIRGSRGLGKKSNGFALPLNISCALVQDEYKTKNQIIKIHT